MSAAPKTPLDEARDALAALYEFTTARDEARDAAYRDYWTSKIDNADARDPEHLRVALAEVDRLTTKNAQLREALTALAGATDDVLACGLDVDPNPYAEGVIADARDEVATARRVLAEVTGG